MRQNFWRTLALAGIILAGCGHPDEPAKPVAGRLEDKIIILSTNEYHYPSANLSPLPVRRAAETPSTAETSPLPVSDVPPVNVLVENPTSRQIQQALKNAGFYDGKIDGILGPKSRRAVRAFQEENGLTVDGKPGPKTWVKLGPYLNPVVLDDASSVRPSPAGIPAMSVPNED